MKMTDRRLKIAIIHPDLGIGGAERLMVDAAVQLTAHGHNVHVFTAHHDRSHCFEETVSGLIPVTVYGGFIPRHLCYRFHAICAYMRCIFIAICILLMWPVFDIILTDQISATIPLLKLKRTTKIIFYCHFPDLLLASHRNVIRRLYRAPVDMIEEATTGMADMVLVNSRFTAATFARTFKYLNARGIKPRILYPAVDLEQFDGPCSYKLNFLSVNRFERKKNIGLAISAFAKLIIFERKGLLGKKINKIRLTIVGGFDKRLRENVEYLDELKILAEREGISNLVSFIPSCSSAERNQLLSECVCVIYTPKDEHFGIVPLEAMAAQKPVIACNSGGPVETIEDGVTGFLCDPTPQDFLQAMLKLIEDPQLAERMGKDARRRASEVFSTRIFGQRLHNIVSNICHRNNEGNLKAHVSGSFLHSQ